MTYTAAVLVGVLAAGLLDLVVLRTRLLGRRVFWVTYPIIVAFQLLFNGVLTGRGVVRYRTQTILGPRLVHAPIEDLLFGFALALATLSLWVWLGRRGAAAPPPARRRSSPR